MKTPEEMLSFALRFGQIELPTRKVEWDKLKADITAFVGGRLGRVHLGTARIVIISPEDEPQELSEKEISQLQEEVARLLVPRTDPHAARIFPHWKGAKGIVSDRPVRVITEWITLIGICAEPIFVIRGTTHDIFLHFLLSLLMQPLATQIRRCPAPSKRNPTQECEKLFLRIRRQIYCSETCTERAGKQTRRRKQRTA